LSNIETSIPKSRNKNAQNDDKKGKDHQIRHPLIKSNITIHIIIIMHINIIYGVPIILLKPKHRLYIFTKFIIKHHIALIKINYYKDI
jgi:hypothetical protein